MKETFCMNMFHCYKILQCICFKIINLKQVHLYKATDNSQLLVLFILSILACVCTKPCGFLEFRRITLGKK